MGRWLTTWPKPLVLTISKAHLASGSRPTSPWTGVLAVVLLARQGSRAVSIVLTFSLPAHYIRVAKVPRGTPALSHGTSWKAFSVHPARSVVPTRVDPLTTGDCVRHRYEASQAPTDGIALPVLHTHRVGATRRGITRVRPRHTSLALTDIASLTVRVSHTLRATPSDRVGLRDEAGLAGTDGVTSMVDITHSSGTTGARLREGFSLVNKIFSGKIFGK